MLPELCEKGGNPLKVGQMSYDAVIVRQRAIADSIGAKYGVKPFVTTEISGAGQHKNCFSTAVPVIDYEKLGYAVTQKQAIDHVKAYGGIFSYNHPFSSSKRSLPPPEEIPALVARIAAGLTASRVYGASLMEVGFTEGATCSRCRITCGSGTCFRSAACSSPATGTATAITTT